MPISLFVSMLAALRRESSSGTSAAAGANGDGSKKKVLASNVDKEIKSGQITMHERTEESPVAQSHFNSQNLANALNQSNPDLTDTLKKETAKVAEIKTVFGMNRWE